MTVPCMHEIENAAELGSDLYLGLPCTDTAQVECLHVYIHKSREFIPVNSHTELLPHVVVYVLEINYNF